MFIRTFIIVCSLFASANASLASPEFWRFEWPETDFDVTTVESWTEIISGGPSKDGIPAIDNPQFIEAKDETRIAGTEPVITVVLDGEKARAYPIRYLTWHEIVNDRIGDRPVTITFCPLCNSGITFDGRTEYGELTFGVSGKLRNSDMVMYDRQTESWWQQAIGEAIVGELTGTQLSTLPTWMESWDHFLASYPDGLVMAEPAFRRKYGANPYVGYDSSRRPFLYSGEEPPHGIPPLARVVRVGDTAWPLTRLAKEGTISEADVVLSWKSGQASALDQRDIGSGRDIGSVRVRDMAGNDVPHDVLFAFAFHAFWPEGKWILAQ